MMNKYEMLFAGKIIDTIDAKDKDEARDIALERKSSLLAVVPAHVEYGGKKIYVDDTDNDDAQDFDDWAFDQITLREKKD